MLILALEGPKSAFCRVEEPFLARTTLKSADFKFFILILEGGVRELCEIREEEEDGGFQLQGVAGQAPHHHFVNKLPLYQVRVQICADSLM